MLVQMLLFFVFFYLRPILEGQQPAYKVIGWLVLFTVVLWESARLAIGAVRRRLPGLGQVRRRILTLAAVLVPVSALTGSWHVWMEGWLGLGQGAEGSVYNYLFSIGMTLFFSQLIAGLHEAVYYLGQWQQSVREGEALKKINLQSQLDSLKNQVNPHFLFNSLNSLSALVEEDPKRAVRFIEELSGMYRYLLQSNEKELIPLGRELDFIRAYHYLLQTRFEDGLSLTIQVDPALENYLLPPLTLQILVENAVKHNRIAASQPLHVRIHSDAGDNLLVVNNLQLRRTQVPSGKMGLVNVAAKYRLLNLPEPVINQTATHFQVIIPLLRHEHAVGSNH